VIKKQNGKMSIVRGGAKIGSDAGGGGGGGAKIGSDAGGEHLLLCPTVLAETTYFFREEFGFLETKKACIFGLGQLIFPRKKFCIFGLGSLKKGGWL
jgi:hypothetical protein